MQPGDLTLRIFEEVSAALKIIVIAVAAITIACLATVLVGAAVWVASVVLLFLVGLAAGYAGVTLDMDGYNALYAWCVVAGLLFVALTIASILGFKLKFI